MIVLALNELNIEYIKKYISNGKLPNFSKILEKNISITKSEKQYELLEPWIQWTTVHTGKTYNEHKVFRLGDIVDRKDLTQIFEYLENSGLSVAAISPFNADNRLKNSSFFVPDPWTVTKTSGSYILRKLSNSISKFVNSNATGKASLSDILWLAIGFIKYVKFTKWLKFFNFFLIRNKPGVKAAILDMILLEVFVTLQKKYKPNYSHLFFNGGAHVQHHFMFNSSSYDGKFKNPEWYCKSNWDPLLMILETYDDIIGELLKTNERIIGLTGLQQVPHDKQTFYWRPKNHKKFLDELGLNYDFEVIPRMSRDFLIIGKSKKDIFKIERELNTFKDSFRGEKIFNVDNRGKSLFVEIIYDKDIGNNLTFSNNDITVNNIKDKLAFVAIKNGKHNGDGYVFSNMKLNLPNVIDLKNINNFLIKTAIYDFEKSKSLN